ncbi:CotH kinase family protein [Armatimonas sp.]|uniref:CotH kinase family protein n=1 Tax=Armatimonas sp. TaxID=1872638 RepID=UPI00286CBFF8|nr:CotH kinase family protein [Armatimonas sp.]
MTLNDLIARQLALLLPPTDPSTLLFKPTGIVPLFQITVDAPNLDLLGKDPRKAVRSQIRIGAQEYKDVGLHLKGAAGSWRDWNDKPGLTLNFDKFVKGQELFGLEKLHLNNGVQDGSYFHELLANELALAMGVPGCRCTHALVELNGRKVGLYVLKEGFDKTWLRRNFSKEAEGNLYDGGFCTDIDGELKLDTGTDNQRRDLKALAEACSQGYGAVERVVDIERFCANAALQIITTDWDGYMRKPNNYRVFLPTKGKAVFIPHGMDQLWQNPEEGIFPGWGGRVAHVILEHPDGKKRLLSQLNEATRRHFTMPKLLGRIDSLTPRTLVALKATGRSEWAGGFENEVRGLKERLTQRMAYLRKELPKLS